MSDMPVVTASYEARYIVLSYINSLTGCVTALELLHQRTSTKGVYNWFLLIASCIAMGGVGIWSMHFIGNRAIVLNRGHTPQIAYNSAFTAISFFLPIMVLLIAFHVLGGIGRTRSTYLVLSGLLTGTAVCGMHFVGNLGILNYSCVYQTANVVGAAIIAGIGSLVALSVFFQLRQKWTDSWWKRSLCAALLASAVSVMHWVAAVGTSYAFRSKTPEHSSMSRVQTVVVCSILSLIACISLLGIVLLRGRKSRIARTRAQQLVLACAYFDDHGRLMVTPEGSLPCQKIANHFVERSFGENELSKSHPTFIWIFKASRNWPVIHSLIPRMIEELDSDPSKKRYVIGKMTSSNTDVSSEVSVNFGALFKQLFCLAAQQLAGLIHEPLDHLGVLFEEPIETGTSVGVSKRKIRDQLLSLMRIHVDSNRIGGTHAGQEFGRGKYLLLNRRLVKHEIHKFAALGYRFGPIQQLAEVLARNMDVSCMYMKTQLDRMRLSAFTEDLPPPGVHIAAFVIRPRVYQSFDILVPAKKQHQLPLISMDINSLTEWQTAFLARLDNWTVRDILKTLTDEAGNRQGERDFRSRFGTAVVRLNDLVGDFDKMLNARFSARQVVIPTQMNAASGEPGSCMLMTVRLMNTIHTKAPGPRLTYVPLSFFSAQQQIDPNQNMFTKTATLGSRCLSPQPTTGRRLERTIQRFSVRDRVEVSKTSVLQHLYTPKRPVTDESEDIRIITASPVIDEYLRSSTEDVRPNDSSRASSPTDVDPEKGWKALVETTVGVETLAFASEQQPSWVNELLGLFR